MQNHHFTPCLIGLLCLLFVLSSHAGNDKVTIFAAASLTNVISEIAKVYEAQYNVRIQTSFASSATLAKQISRGAPADIFISADQQWMDYIHKQRFIKPESRQNIVKNHLVLIAPAKNPFLAQFQTGFNLPDAFTGKLCTGQVDAVPAGIYAKQALQFFHWWPALKHRVIGAQNVRSALVYVERGECAAGIVYETDAYISKNVTTLARFPSKSHQPIRYPAALTTTSSPPAAHFLQFLQSGAAKAIFKQHHFLSLAP